VFARDHELDFDQHVSRAGLTCSGFWQALIGPQSCLSCSTIHHKECVARGCALYAAAKSEAVCMNLPAIQDRYPYPVVCKFFLHDCSKRSPRQVSRALSKHGNSEPVFSLDRTAVMMIDLSDLVCKCSRVEGLFQVVSDPNHLRPQVSPHRMHPANTWKRLLLHEFCRWWTAVCTRLRL